MKTILSQLISVVLISIPIMCALALIVAALKRAGDRQRKKDMKVVYIAHPISGDVAGNMERVKNIVREINITKPDVVPFAHYYVDCHALDDTIPAERERGIKNDTALLKSGCIDEMWLYGDRISTGMKHEIELAETLEIPVFAKTEGTMRDWINGNINEKL